MKILLDENTPLQVRPALQQVLGDEHQVDHVDTIKWNGKKDKHLIPDAIARGYDVIVTKDSYQLDNPLVLMRSSQRVGCRPRMVSAS